MKALLVIDMLKDFVDKDGALFCGKQAREIVPFVRKKIEEARQKANFVIFICDAHKEDDLEFGLFPKHCIEGTRSAEIIDELEVFDSDIIIKKTRYSGFYGTNLERVLIDHAIDEVEVVGVCTSICVMDTIGDLRNRDYRVIVYRDGVADFDPSSGEFALKRIEKIYGAEVVGNVY